MSDYFSELVPVFECPQCSHSCKPDREQLVRFHEDRLVCPKCNFRALVVINCMWGNEPGEDPPGQEEWGLA